MSDSETASNTPSPVAPPAPPPPPAISTAPDAQASDGTDLDRQRFLLFANVAARFPKDKLRKTATVVTRADGTRFVEDRPDGDASVVSAADNRLFIELPALSSRYDDSKPCKIRDSLYIGSYEAASKREAIVGERITHILNAASGILDNRHTDIVTYHNIPLDDVSTANAAKYFEDAIAFVTKAIEGDGRVLIHCFAGISRSATFAIAFLMHYHEVPLDTAHAMVKKARPIIMPNNGFWNQLQQYEKQLAASGKIKHAKI